MKTTTKTPRAEAAAGPAAPARRIPVSGLSPAMRWALLTCLLLALVFGVTNFIAFFRYYGFLAALTAGLVFLAAVLILASVGTLLFAALRRLRWQTVFVILASAFLCVTAASALAYLLPLLVFCLIAVYLAVMCASGRYGALRKPKRILRYGLLGLSGALAALTAFLAFTPGPSLKAGDRPDRATLALPYAVHNEPAPAIGDPSRPGGHPYSVFYYAAPGQKTDPYPGQDTLAATTADASALLEGWGGLREMLLGFGPDALPLNARVWMPEGDGPFPLALMVHGNHDSGDRSDGGYAYLGELLASRGVIAASVDENFLNSSPLYDILVFAGLEGENDARAFVLLEHLRQWHAWNAEPSHPFFGKADFDNIALIGHSRGGEAAALAAAFAGLGRYPDNGRVTFDYPFRIKTVAAIAPTHRQYDPAGMEVSLAGVNYLTLHGGHDMDVSSFSGANMYGRAGVSEYGVKARVWMQYANHGQFNTAWGKNDVPGLMTLLVNGNLLMPMEEQQQAAKVFISAFLESTLLGKTEYDALFRDFANGADWLPPALYVTSWAGAGAVTLDGFDGGFDLETSASGLAAYSAEGFDTWTQAELPGKGTNSNRVLVLQWGGREYREKYGGDSSGGARTPVFKTEFAPGALSAGDRLYLSLCSAGEDAAGGPDVSFQIRLTDGAGRTAEMGVADFGGVAAPIDAPVFKPPFSAMMGVREPVLQMICIPTGRFEGLDGDIISMEWVMGAGAGETDAGFTLYADDLRVEKPVD